MPKAKQIGCKPKCSVASCVRESHCRSWCVMHYSRWRNGRPIGDEVPLCRKGGILSLRDSEGRKSCGRCNEWKHLHEFGHRETAEDGLEGACRSCISSAKRKLRYGVDTQAMLDMLEAQGGCGICGGQEPGPKGWNIDHDHKCCPTGETCGRCVRGVLCGNCNWMIGLARDNVETLLSAVSYLERGVNDRRVHIAQLPAVQVDDEGARLFGVAVSNT